MSLFFNNKYKSSDDKEEDLELEKEAISLRISCGYIPSIKKCKTALLINNRDQNKAREWLIKN